MDVVGTEVVPFIQGAEIFCCSCSCSSRGMDSSLIIKRSNNSSFSPFSYVFRGGNEGFGNTIFISSSLSSKNNSILVSSG